MENDTMSKELHCMSIDSDLGQDIMYLESNIEQLVKWLSNGYAATKSELIIVLRRIRGTADAMEYQLKKSGYDYMDVKE